MVVWMCNMLTLLFGYNWFIGMKLYNIMVSLLAINNMIYGNMLTLLFGYNWFIGDI